MIGFLKKTLTESGVVALAFNPSTREAEAGRSLEFKVSLVYRVNSRIAKATQRNPIGGGGKKEKEKNMISYQIS